MGSSIWSGKLGLDSTPYLVVGTGIALPTDDEPLTGRVLVFKVAKKKLVLVNELEVPGCTYSIASLHGKLVAGVNSKVF